MTRLRSGFAPLGRHAKDAYRRIRVFLGPATTRWSRFVIFAWVCVLCYALVEILAAVGLWKTIEHPVENALNALFAVALMILSIRYSGVLNDFYQRLTGFGITDIRVNRHGQDPTLTEIWMKRIGGSNDIQIVGTLSRGWFRIAGENLGDLLSRSDKVHIRVYLLDPFGTIWRGLIATGTQRHSTFVDDATEVFRTLQELAKDYPKQFLVHLYDTEPMSFVKAAGTIYLGLYLPRTSRKEIPECTISEGSFLGQKVIESARKLMVTAPHIEASKIGEYRHIMQTHSVDTSYAFWADPKVTCDFCKEIDARPSTFSRRHTEIKSRLVATGTGFILPSLGPLVPGHALLLPREHVTSLARLNDSVAFGEITSRADEWAQKIASIGETPLMFEHGTPSDDNTHGGCGICHCHLHLVPLPHVEGAVVYSRLKAFLVTGGYPSDFIDADNWDALHTYADQAYLAVRVGNDKLRVLPLRNEAVQSQLLRRFVAEELLPAAPNWDWRDAESDSDAGGSEIRECLDRLRQMFPC
jgi:diadenosine tetraphosphate (Ap4A) HIT family hydrolase